MGRVSLRSAALGIDCPSPDVASHAFRWETLGTSGEHANSISPNNTRLYKVHCWRVCANELLRLTSKSDSPNSHGGSRASYSSLRRKKRDRQAGDSADTPSEESARLSQAVSVFLNSVLCGVPTVPLHPTLKN
jgi:hypothetical protein